MSEECDGTDLGGATCADAGCAAGDPICTASCILDFSGCTICCNNNGVCESGEDCTLSPNDCISGTVSGVECGNGTCEAADGENCVNCPQDCNGAQKGNPANRFCCGDGGGQNPVPCSNAACTAGGLMCIDQPAVVTFCCGDGACTGNEDSANCLLDCPDCVATHSREKGRAATTASITIVTA